MSIIIKFDKKALTFIRKGGIIEINKMSLNINLVT